MCSLNLYLFLLSHLIMMSVLHFSLLLVFDCPLEIFNCTVIDLLNTFNLSEGLRWLRRIHDFTLFFRRFRHLRSRFLEFLINSDFCIILNNMSFLLCLLSLLSLLLRRFCQDDVAVAVFVWIAHLIIALINFARDFFRLLRFFVVDSFHIHFMKGYWEAGSACLETHLRYGCWTVQHSSFRHLWALRQRCRCYTSYATLL